MALGANSYGDTGEIGSMLQRHANASRVFDASTKPTLTRLEGYVDQISATLNIELAEVGFDIPITQADCVLALDLFVNKFAADIVEGINGYGRFGPSPKKSGTISWYTTLLADAKAFVRERMAGFERLGAVRDYSQTAGLGYRATDESGNETFPIFQRSAFGNTFKDWDNG